MPAKTYIVEKSEPEGFFGKIALTHTQHPNYAPTCHLSDPYMRVAKPVGAADRKFAHLL
jgi:hypothetical protein